MRGTSLAKVALLAGVLAGAPAKARPHLDAAQLEQLSRYDVLHFADPFGPAGSGLLRHKGIGVFDASPDEVFHVVRGYDRYRDYIPRMISSHTVWQAGEQAMVLLHADLPWPFHDVWVYARFIEEGPTGDSYKIRFTMVRGNLLRYEGMFLIEPFDEGRSAVTYELVVQTDMRVPRAVLNAALSHGVSLFVHCLRSRVNLLAQKQRERREPGEEGPDAPAPSTPPPVSHVAEEPSAPRPAT